MRRLCSHTESISMIDNLYLVQKVKDPIYTQRNTTIIQNSHSKLQIRGIPRSTLGRRQSKTLILSPKTDQKSLKTVFSTGDKWKQKTLFPAILDPRVSIVKNVFDCRLPGVISQCKADAGGYWNRIDYSSAARENLEYYFITCIFPNI